ncbi:MAG: RecX family transcriptional regulator [Patescibacteria group bacterium]|jgi:regulatory protein
MEITKISPQAKNPERINLYVDGKFYRGLDRLVAMKLGLKSGLILNPKLLDQLETTQSENSAWEWALKSLQISPKSKRDMGIRLRRKFEPPLVEAVMERLTNANLLDDQKLAEQWINRFVLQNTKSRKEILLKLRQKGIEESAIKSAAAGIPDGTIAVLNLAKIKNRSLKRELSWKERFEKLASYLARKGFSYQEIRQTVTPTNLEIETD